jgi:hypothetical protein
MVAAGLLWNPNQQLEAVLCPTATATAAAAAAPATAR